MSGFQTCDIRGKPGEKMKDEIIACRIGCAHARHLNARRAAAGGETGVRHYFRDFACRDSGMAPWLPDAEPVSTADDPLSKPVDERMAALPYSGEASFRVHEAQAHILADKNQFQSPSPPVYADTADGLSMEFTGWRFNLRPSNTEPLLRLNVETRGSHAQAGKRVSHQKAV